MSLSRELAILSTKQHECETDYMVHLKELKRRVDELYRSFEEDNVIDRDEAAKAAYWAVSLAIRASLAYNFRDLVRYLAQE
jgi:hypothetical protein